MRHLIITILMLVSLTATAQQTSATRIYDETLNPINQIDSTLTVATASGHNVLIQLGGNWCRWCIMFAQFVKNDAELTEVIEQNYHFIHVNYPARGGRDNDVIRQLEKRLKNANRFGFPVLIVMNPKGEILHIQDSALLEEVRVTTSPKYYASCNNGPQKRPVNNRPKNLIARLSSAGVTAKRHPLGCRAAAYVASRQL